MSMNVRFCLLVLNVAHVVPHMLSRNVFRSFLLSLKMFNAFLHSFYVENCLQSFPTSKEANEMLMKLRSSLVEGGFEIRQWAGNHVSVIDHLDPWTQLPFLAGYLE